MLELAVGGGLQPVANPRGESIRFETPAPRLEYGSLVVRDADGKSMPARFGAEDHLVRLEVEDGDAVYPITIDPLMTVAGWTVLGDQHLCFLGFSVASAGNVNGDGYSDVIVGAYKYNNVGRAYVFLGWSLGSRTEPLLDS